MAEGNRQFFRPRLLRATIVLALVFAAGAVLVALLTILSPATFQAGREVAVDFAYAGPIKPGAAVRIAGVTVGTVTEVTFLGGQPRADLMVRVHARVGNNASHLLTSNSRFYVTTLGVLGEYYLDIEPRTGEPLAKDTAVVGVSLPRADLLLPQAAGLVSRVDALFATLDPLATAMEHMASSLSGLDTSRSAQLIGLLDDASAIARAARVGLGDGHDLERTLELLPATLNDTRAVEDRLLTIATKDAATSTQAALLRVDRLAETLEDVAGRLRLSPVLDAGRQEALLRQAETTASTLTRVANRADGLLVAIDNKRGLAGQLFWDEALARDVRALVSEARRHPMRLLLPDMTPEAPDSGH